MVKYYHITCGSIFGGQVTDAKDITDFIILGVHGTIGANTITLTVPFGSPAVLTPTISITGASVSPASGVPTDFTAPQTYRVTAADGTTKDYTVTVTEAPSYAKDITDFTILGVHGTIGANTITLTVPFGSPAVLTPTITITGSNISPASGVPADFTAPQTYRVTAADGTTKDYTVTVTKAANSAKDITDFTILGVHGTIGANTIALTVPFGSPAVLTPTITITGSSISPVSGVPTDFTSPRTYRVTAADSTTKDYTVTVTEALNSAKDITDFTILGVHGTIGANTISLALPYGTSLTSLKPTIAITGASITPTSGIAQSFTNPLTYTVKAADNTTKNYTATVVALAPSVTEWTKLWGVAGKGSVYNDIKVDINNDVYVVGDTSVDVYHANCIVVKYSSNGVMQLIGGIGIAGANTQSSHMTFDSNNNVYVTGSTNGNLDGQTLTGTVDSYVTKLGQWTRLQGVVGKFTQGMDVKLDSSNNVYVTGTRDRSLFVTKYDSSGVKQWTSLQGVVGKDTSGSGITVDSNNNIYVAGKTNGNLDGQTLIGSNDCFVAKYDSSGVKQWTKLLGFASVDSGCSDITSDSSNNVYVTSNNYPFVAKYDSSGVQQWTILVPGGYSNNVNGIKLDSNNNIYVVGNRVIDNQTLDGDLPPENAATSYVIVFNQKEAGDEEKKVRH